ncbi:hypothetical protein ASE92_12555 [Pedobacter sp. Leaf41]|uniref:MamI family restriction endonuclease n=1 Tax=Pedobacter sp. Leaf41 TaxID=1736218 RepID=UPI00070316D9|nr:MamI family restriction endonuclease [Pedobacter sp. Leaf41]KQN34423.1 hypothetical protein ASE92_12555 [Pedobacter sp. Leaf41]
MKPNPKLITIDDNKAKISILLKELVLDPRLKALGWSNVTKQTPNMKVGYPGQHLASLITGIEGSRTGARGDDLRDGTEVKSCSRVDQLDTCKACKEKVLRVEKVCSVCGSEDIRRMDDSKWLFSIRSEDELALLTKTVDRIFLTIADYPRFSSGNYDTIRFQAFEIWNSDPRHKHFASLMTNYYLKMFLEHKKLSANKTPAPKNFWPYSYQFFLCNPVKVFECVVTDANTKPIIDITHYIEPHVDRSDIASEMMPTSILNPEELYSVILSNSPDDINTQLIEGFDYDGLVTLMNSGQSKDIREIKKALPYIDESTRTCLSLRDTDKISVAKTPYLRR